MSALTSVFLWDLKGFYHQVIINITYMQQQQQAAAAYWIPDQHMAVETCVSPKKITVFPVNDYSVKLIHLIFWDSIILYCTTKAVYDEGKRQMNSIRDSIVTSEP